MVPEPRGLTANTEIPHAMAYTSLGVDLGLADCRFFRGWAQRQKAGLCTAITLIGAYGVAKMLIAVGMT